MAEGAAADERPRRQRATAATFIAAVGDISRFSSPRKLVSYLGLDPSVRQSGSGPARHGRISKADASEARHMLGEAACKVTLTPGLAAPGNRRLSVPELALGRQHAGWPMPDASSVVAPVPVDAPRGDRPRGGIGISGARRRRASRAESRVRQRSHWTKCQSASRGCRSGRLQSRRLRLGTSRKTRAGWSRIYPAWIKSYIAGSFAPLVRNRCGRRTRDRSRHDRHGRTTANERLQNPPGLHHEKRSSTGIR